MRVVFGEAHTQSCVSCQQHCKSSDESGRLLLGVRVLLICREGHMVSYACKALMYGAL